MNRDERFWRHIEADGECLIWRGARWSVKGHCYGKATWAGGVRTAQQVAWEEVNGPLPLGAVLRNSCGRTLCVRPDHWRRDDRPERDRVIRARRRAGERLKTLAAEFGISRQRVSQIALRGDAA
jgi:hypothetical protein